MHKFKEEMLIQVIMRRDLFLQFSRSCELFKDQWTKRELAAIHDKRKIFTLKWE